MDRRALRALAANRKGAAAIREALGDGAAPTRSGLEDAFLDLLRRAGLPTPRINRNHEGRVLDFVWERERVIIEADGWAAHGRRSAFESDRERDLDHSARGYRTGRVTWRSPRGKPTSVAARVGALPLAHSAASSHQ